jgi:hypothetical protein
MQATQAGAQGTSLHTLYGHTFFQDTHALLYSTEISAMPSSFRASTRMLPVLSRQACHFVIHLSSSHPRFETHLLTI